MRPHSFDHMLPLGGSMAASAALKSPPASPARVEADERTYEARFTASIDAGLADADADDVMDTDELERWLAARRSERPRR